MIEYENLEKANKPFFEEYKQAFSDILHSGRYILGDAVKRFEAEFAAYCGARYCIGVASGLDALILSLGIYRFKTGSEVIVPANTYIATILSVLHCGLKPVLVEPDIKTYNIDPSRIEDAITPKTAAIMVVHLYGKMCDMDPVLRIARQRKLKVIEDCAQAHGSLYKGKKAGTFGDCNAFSFYPTKNLGALGDAGAVVTDDPYAAEQVRMYGNYGSKVKYYNEAIGCNSRLDEVQSGFLSIKLRKLDNINDHKRKLSSLYLERIKSDFIKPDVSEEFHDTYHIFNIRHPERDRLRNFLLERGIMTEIHYPVPPHRQKALSGILDNLEYPISKEIHATTLSLPVSYGHQERDICEVIEILNGFH
jgi:dTDP-4-amino-4,6-dideoxygalactose transaminase